MARKKKKQRSVYRSGRSYLKSKNKIKNEGIKVNDT